VTTQPVPSY